MRYLCVWVQNSGTLTFLIHGYFLDMGTFLPAELYGMNLNYFEGLSLILLMVLNLDYCYLGASQLINLNPARALINAK